ncbi:choice-of-anchor tandem repeat GloVer-containing protein [uncultured Kordia sp.]|uniref:choice-of-anchor tandem repeat GloVer-containing protein n=1 Tax=uncultured Kordia sp. TaxID=507699 RepID=UPI0026074560|nr:choice-of-anchor tandem repeat GloVer-containing protein [uncultured Kordia sp.]
MKRIIFVLLFFPFLAFSQTNYLGFASNDQSNSFGTIIQITDDVPQTKYTFTDNGAPPHDNIVEIGGKYYGVTDEDGFLGEGSLYEYDPVSENFQILHFFEAVGTTDTNYITELCTDSVSIYALQQQFFTGTSIVRYDINSQTITPLVSLASIGVSEVIDLIYTSNGKLYGLSRPTAQTNILFSYDIATATLAIEHTFATATGDWCHSLMEHSNGNIYGATTYGGTNDEGVIFEFNTTTNTYSVLYDLSASEKADNLTEGGNNMLYGYVYPLTGGGARIYEFDLTTVAFNNVYSFPSNVQPIGNEASFRGFEPLLFDAGKLYGVSLLQSNSDEQLFFKYDIANSTIDLTLNGLDDGVIRTSLFKTSDNRIVYGNQIYQGNGNLMEYDTTTQSTSALNRTDFGTDGKTPNAMIKASDGTIYGVCGTDIGSNYEDRFFSFDPDTDAYSVLIDFATIETFSYGNDPVSLIETTNGLIYIYTRFGGFASGQGTLIEYDPSDGSHSLAHFFGTLSDGSTIGERIRLFEKDNIIYGIKRWAGNGVLYRGTIFSYNTLTHTYNALYESDDLVNTVASFFSSDGIMYGVTSSGGTNNEGFVFSFDTQTSQFTIIEHLTQSGQAGLVEVPSGDIYGTLENSHGTDGSIFKIDGATGVFSILYQFDHAVNQTGRNPTELYTVNNNLYIESQTVFPSIGIPISSYLTEYKLDSDIVTLIFDSNGSGNNPNGISSAIAYNRLSIMNDGRLLVPSYTGTSSPYSLVSFEQGNTAMNVAFNFDGNTELAFNIIDLSDDSLSTETFKENLNVSVFPNPTQDFLQISSPSAISTIEIYSFQGQKLVSYSNQEKIDVRNLSNGLYFLKVKDVFGKLQTVKFIKQ